MLHYSTARRLNIALKRCVYAPWNHFIPATRFASGVSKGVSPLKGPVHFNTMGYLTPNMLFLGHARIQP
jgi:hypothetical protein